MSENKDRFVLKFIEKQVAKYRIEAPAFEKDTVRKLVLGDLAEKSITVDKDSSAYRKLSRELTKSFKIDPKETERKLSQLLNDLVSTDPKKHITINGKEPQWIEQGYSWIDPKTHLSYSITRRKVSEKV
jgi:hypothetical protein